MHVGHCWKRGIYSVMEYLFVYLIYFIIYVIFSSGSGHKDILTEGLFISETRNILIITY